MQFKNVTHWLGFSIYDPTVGYMGKNSHYGHNAAMPVRLGSG